MATQIPSYFFLDGNLLKQIRIVRAENLLVAWSYDKQKRMWFNYQQTLKNFQNAYKIDEVADLLHRDVNELKRMVKSNLVSSGSGMSYSMQTLRPLTMFWSEDDVFNVRSELFALARRNKYGEPYSNLKLVTEAELLSKIRGGDSYFIQDKNGKFVKVWRAI